MTAVAIAPLPGKEERSCGNCRHGGRPVAMLIIECASPDGAFSGRRVMLDEFHPCWAAKGEPS